MNQVCCILSFVVLVIVVTECQGTCQESNYGCPDSWVDWFASCYNRFLLRKTYKDALEYCQTFQATLVNINSNEENTFVHNTFVKNMEYRQAYIGVVRAQPGKETFVTSEGKPQKYFNWARGEPNNFLRENCVEMRRGDEWNDIKCSTKHPFICEFSQIKCEKDTCKNGGTCIDLPKENSQGYQCKCQEPFYGKTCEKMFKGCDEGWIAFGHDCYRIIPGERPWNVAKAVCEIQHGNLVAVKSEEENAFINKNFSKYNLWVGIIECLCGKKCAVDFSKVKYSKWDTCEPKDLDEAKGCALIEKGTGKWQNRDCNERHHTLCKRDEPIVFVAQA